MSFSQPSSAFTLPQHSFMPTSNGSNTQGFGGIGVGAVHEKQNVGRIVAIKGPMFGGKSSALIYAANIFTRCKVPVYIVAPEMSKRKETEAERIESHDGITPLCKTVYLQRSGLAEHCKQFLADFKARLEKQQHQSNGNGSGSGGAAKPIVAPVLCIDEAQFFDDLIDSCCALRRQGVTVIVAGLTLTFERQPFGEMHRLLDFADEIVEKKAVCAICNTLNATLTHRTSTEKGVVVVGGADVYKPVCQMCYEHLHEQK